MTVLLLEKDHAALLYIAENLRARDREEIYATRWGDDPEQLARDTFAAGDFQWIAWVDGVPVASIGAFPSWPGVWTCWAYGTDDWNKVAITLTKHVRRSMIPTLVEMGAHRVQCHALEKHIVARAWLESLGAEPEVRLDNYGRQGQTFVLYSWRQDTTRKGAECAM